jgi:hypothetical protein
MPIITQVNIPKMYTDIKRSKVRDPSITEIIGAVIDMPPVRA